MFYVLLLMGLFSTQLGLDEAMVRVVTDVMQAMGPRMRELVEGDPRRFH